MAMLFISIAFFGYMSLHIRLMHSGGKLELRQIHREKVGLEILSQVALARSQDIGLKHPEFPKLRRLVATESWTDKNGDQSILVETEVIRLEWGW